MQAAEILHFAAYVLRLAVYILHFSVHVQHFAVYILHFALYKLQFAVYVLHFAFFATKKCVACDLQLGVQLPHNNRFFLSYGFTSHHVVFVVFNTN
jgi:hypothetical protein